MRAMQTVILAAAIGGAGLSCKTDEASITATEIASIRAASVAAGGTIAASAPPQRGSWSVQSSWDIETSKTWSAYRGAFGRAIPGEYRSGELGERGASFLRFLRGDTFYIRVEVLDTGPPLRLRVTFTAHAD